MQFLSYPKELNFQTSENLAQTWMKWQEHFTLYLIATRAAEKTGKGKTSILLTCIGEKSREIYSTFEFKNGHYKYNLETVIEKFINYSEPRKKTQIFTCKQKDHKRFDNYVTELRSKASQCEFGEISNRLRKDMLVYGQRGNALRERMFREPDLTLEKAIPAGQSAKETKRQTELMTKTPETENIDSVQKRGINSGKFKNTRNEEDKMADTPKQEDRKPN